MSTKGGEWTFGHVVTPAESRRIAGRLRRVNQEKRTKSVGLLVPMSMVEIGIMRVPVHERLVPMPVVMRLIQRIIRPVLVLVVLVMRMAMLMLQCVMYVLMLVALS